MTRPIKFRAWDTHLKKMWSAEEMGRDELSLIPDGRGFANVSSVSPNLTQWLNHLIPLQYTGLKDKNGVEIYEGDVLKGAPSGWKKEFQIFYLAEVYFGDCGWRAKEKVLDRELPIHIHMQGSYGVEVIGNVYENPELLEEKK